MSNYTYDEFVECVDCGKKLALDEGEECEDGRRCEECYTEQAAIKGKEGE